MLKALPNFISYKTFNIFDIDQTPVQVRRKLLCESSLVHSCLNDTRAEFRSSRRH